MREIVLIDLKSPENFFFTKLWQFLFTRHSFIKFNLLNGGRGSQIDGSDRNVSNINF